MMPGPIPPLWTPAASPIITAAMFSGVSSGPNELGYLSVIRAEGRLASPIDKWYGWCAPHNSPGGIYFATAPAPDGPWTKYSDFAVLIKTSGADHVSSPCVLWNPNTSKFMLWAHQRVIDQETWLWDSPDGITWTIRNGGNPVLTVGGASDADSHGTPYLHVHHDGTQYVGTYQCENGAAGGGRIGRATSPDGMAWTKEPGPSANHATLALQNTTAEYAPCSLRLGSDEFVFYRNNPTPGHAWYRRYRDGLWSSPRYAGIELSSGYAVVAFSDFVYSGGKFYGYYTELTDANTSAGGRVGVASWTYPQSGFDTTWGKG